MGLMRSSFERNRSIGVAAALTALVAAGAGGLAAAAPAAAATAAPGVPGAVSHFDLARKDCVGTARDRTSKVWFTVADGVLSDVYEPTIDTTNVETMQFVVTDGRTFTDLQTRDLTYTVSADATGMACTVTATSAGARLPAGHRPTSPTRPATRVLSRTRFSAIRGGPAASGLRLYVRLRSHGGRQRRRRRRERRRGQRRRRPVHRRPDPGRVRHQHRDQRRRTATTPCPPTWRCGPGPPFAAGERGYAGTASDGLAQLDSSRTLTGYDSGARTATSSQTAEVTPRHGQDGEPRARLRPHRRRRRSPPPAHRWRARSHATGRPTPEDGSPTTPGCAARRPRTPACPPTRAARLRAAYYLSANVLKASEDKTFPGAVVAVARAARGVRPCRPRTRRAASRSTSGRTARSSPATCTRRSPGCSPRAMCRPPATRSGSCSSASSSPTGGSRATPWSTASWRRTAAATSWTRRRTRS